jgi:hypothetical protein
MKIAMFFMVVSSVFGFSNPVSAQCGPLDEGKPTVISLSLSAVHDSIKAGSPVLMKVVLKNKSDHDLSVFLLDAAGENQYLAEVYDEKRQVPTETEHGKIINGHVPNELLKPKDMTFNFACFAMKPGETITHDLNLSRIYNFDKPGKYEIQVQRGAPESLDYVKSNKVTVTVTP